MSRESRDAAKLLKSLGLIIFWWLGIVPLLVLFSIEVMLVTPYVSIVAAIAGAYIYNHSRKMKNPGEIHDR